MILFTEYSSIRSLYNSKRVVVESLFLSYKRFYPVNNLSFVIPVKDMDWMISSLLC